MNLQEIDRLMRTGWTLRVSSASELYAHPFSAYLDAPETDHGHAAVGSTLELALMQLEHYISKQRPAPETPADDVCPTTGQPHRMPKGQVCLYCHIGNLGQFVRGDICPTSCKNCGRHYNDHTHTDEASRCPPKETPPAPSAFPQHICRHGHPDRTCRECFPLNR